MRKIDVEEGPLEAMAPGPSGSLWLTSRQSSEGGWLFKLNLSNGKAPEDDRRKVTDVHPLSVSYSFVGA